jgi:formylglycine-generating enzyme required for sulfatase activity
VAEALAYAASQGILHRDIKPSNLLLDGTGNVWVTDFGLAKTDSDADNLTHTGDIVGTLRYLAPERFGGKGDVRSDVYSLGLTLYELLTLRRAFDETDRNKLVSQVMHHEPLRPRKLNPKVPRDLETVVLKAIAHDPAHRYQTPTEMAEDLKRFVEDRPVRARRVSEVEKLWRWCRRNPLAASLVVGIILVFLAGFAGVFWQWRVAEEQAEITLVREKETRQEADKAKKARDFLISTFRLSEKANQAGALTAREILDGAAQRIPREFAGQPELQKELLDAIEKIYDALTADAPLAMILEARGTVRAQSSKGLERALVPQTLLFSGDRLTLAADAQVQLVLLWDLHQERLRPGTEVTLRRKGCEPPGAVLQRDNSILMTFVPLPKGTFYMGGGGGRVGKETQIKEDVEIAVHSVTQGQWQAVMGNNPSAFSRFGSSRHAVKDLSDEELKLLPVESVSWNDVQEFLKKLNEQQQGKGCWYRLPSEAEWEYACRGGATAEEECSYHFYGAKPANDLSSDQANFDGNMPAGNAPKGKFLERPTRVGAYPPNNLGLCDLHGNVAQWCGDLHRSGAVILRAMRGGAWFSSGNLCQAGLVNRYTETFGNNGLGFRLVRVPLRSK